MTMKTLETKMSFRRDNKSSISFIRQWYAMVYNHVVYKAVYHILGYTLMVNIGCDDHLLEKLIVSYIINTLKMGCYATHR